MPVIKLQFRGALKIDEVLPPAGAVTLEESDAEKFYNYNGEGYEAPKTLYKLHWTVHPGCASLTFHVNGEGRIALVSNGQAPLVAVNEGMRENVIIGADRTLELTPPEPFLKGTALPLSLRSIELKPQSCSR